MSETQTETQTETIPPVEQKSDGENLLKLTENEVLRLDKFHALVRAANAELLTMLGERKAYLQKVDPGGILENMARRIQALREEKAASEAGYKESLASAEKRLGISLKDYAYDEVTGILRPVGQATDEELKELEKQAEKTLPIPEAQS